MAVGPSTCICIATAAAAILISYFVTLCVEMNFVFCCCVSQFLSGNVDIQGLINNTKLLSSILCGGRDRWACN